MVSNRQKKIAQLIQKELSEIFLKQVAGTIKNLVISVSGVRVSADLGVAKAYISIFPPEFRDKIMNEINANKSHYRNLIGMELRSQLRIIPQISFFLDTTLDDVENIDRELKGLGDNPIL